MKFLIVLLVCLSCLIPIALADNANYTSLIYNAPYQFAVPASQNSSSQSTVPGSMYYVARGESAAIPFNHAGGTCWFFQQAGGTYGPQYYDVPSVPNGNQSECEVTQAMTGGLPLGPYTVFYTFPVVVNNKTIKDVTWQNDKLVSIFGQNEPIDETGHTPAMVLSDLENLIEKDNIDGIESSQVTIQKPIISIDRLEQTAANTITLSGTTNLNGGDPISVLIDNGNFNQSKVYAANFSYTINVSRPYQNAYGTFSIDMQLPLQFMPDGWHEVTATGDGVVSTVRFQTSSSSDWTPVPTPTQYYNYFSNGSIKPDVVTVVQTIVIVQTVEEWHTATPTPFITDVLGGTIDYPFVPGDKIPEGVALVGAICLAGIVLMRDWKRR